MCDGDCNKAVRFQVYANSKAVTHKVATNWDNEKKQYLAKPRVYYEVARGEEEYGYFDSDQGIPDKVTINGVTATIVSSTFDADKNIWKVNTDHEIVHHLDKPKATKEFDKHIRKWRMMEVSKDPLLIKACDLFGCKPENLDIEAAYELFEEIADAKLLLLLEAL